MTIQTLEAQLKKIERQRALLSKRLAARKARQFTALPAKVGLRSVDALILSLSPYAIAEVAREPDGQRRAADSEAGVGEEGRPPRAAGALRRRGARLRAQAAGAGPDDQRRDRQEVRGFALHDQGLEEAVGAGEEGTPSRSQVACSLPVVPSSPSRS
mgnify:CR=1 FL=1